RDNSTPFSSRAPSRAASSRVSSRVSFIPSSRASSPASFVTSDVMSRPASAMSIYSSMGGAESDPEFPEPGDLLGISPAAGPPAAAVPLAANTSAEKSDTARVTGKGKGKAKRKGEAKIMITREEKVDAIVDSSTVESTWTVPRSSIAIR
ncbi:hypothetical protein B0H16DRAFT_1810252, partial [Mycena metata]